MDGNLVKLALLYDIRRTPSMTAIMSRQHLSVERLVTAYMDLRQIFDRQCSRGSDGEDEVEVRSSAGHVMYVPQHVKQCHLKYNIQLL